LKDKQKTSLVYTVIAILVGYSSFLITQSYETNLYQPFLALLVLFLMAEIMKVVFKINKNFKWFMSGGGWLYLFIWFITWIVFYNL
jgi:hypothetical protein